MKAPDFDPVARAYRFLEYGAFGPALWRRREAFLGETTGAASVLMAGEGDGRFLDAFLRTNPNAVVDYLDASPAMTSLARARAGDGEQRVQFRTANALTHPFGENRYDLIITHFFLDCFLPEELKAIVPKIAAAAKPEAAWIVSEFRIPSPPAAAMAAHVLIGGLYLFFGVTTGLRPRRLPAHAALLERAGFHREREELALGGLLTSELWRR